MFRYLILVLIGLNSFFGYSQTNDSLFVKLEEAILSRDLYLNQKIGRINEYYKQLYEAESLKQFNRIYDLKLKLFNEYESFIYDSAFKYVMEVKKIAEKEKDNHKIATAKLSLGFVLLSSGLFKEAIDTLKSINDYKSDSFRAELNATIGRSYYDLADYSNDKYYNLPNHSMIWQIIVMTSTLLLSTKMSVTPTLKKLVDSQIKNPTNIGHTRHYAE